MKNKSNRTSEYEFDNTQVDGMAEMFLEGLNSNQGIPDRDKLAKEKQKRE